MYQPSLHPSPPPSPASSYAFPHRPLPPSSSSLSSHPPGGPSTSTSAFGWARLGRQRRGSTSSSLESGDSTGALVGNAAGGWGDDGRATGGSRGEEGVEILLPSFSSRPNAPAHSYAGDDDDPTPTPGPYLSDPLRNAAYAPPPSGSSSRAHDWLSQQPTSAASDRPSHASPSSSSFAYTPRGGYAASVAESERSVGSSRSGFDRRDGGWAAVPAAGGAGVGLGLSRTASRSSVAGSELDEKFDYTSWDLSRPSLASGVAAAAAEPDDWLHDPALLASDKGHGRGTLFTKRGVANLGCLAVLTGALFMLFAGYPIISVLQQTLLQSTGSFNLGGVNGTGQVPSVVGDFGLVDRDTPEEALTRIGVGGGNQGETYELVFSDEFEVDGRSFYAGDDPYWEAADLHYWATNNLEWYDPRMVTTANGSLVITLQPADPATNHNLDYIGGMLSTWNKFCFTGGYIESKVRLPGSPQVWGLWPAVWTLGNLGRAGYGATLDGMWPYTYESTCDLGTLANQTYDGLPTAALTTGSSDYGGSLSYLPGQRLSACTCASDPTHPGPVVSGQFVGRGAPEIDILEAQVDTTLKEGKVSMSAQWAPFDASYDWNNATGNYEIYNSSLTELNGYKGGITQEASSGIVTTDQEAYQYPLSGSAIGGFSVYGFEYQPSNDAYITWVSDSVPAWTIYQAALGPNSESEVSERPVPTEPLYIIANLGISNNFGAIDYDGLADLWPAKMEIDYIRVYQRADMKNIGCDPSDRPTAAYIDEHLDLYSNPNLTTYADGGYTQPLNKLQLKSEGKTC